MFDLLYIFLPTNATALPYDFLSSLLTPSTITNYNSERTNINHIVFGIIGSAQGWNNRGPYIDLWWRPNKTRGYVWLDHAPSYSWPDSTPPYRVSEDTSKFRAYDKHGMPFAVRMTRLLMESYRTADMRREVRWAVMVDDDTVLFLDNLVGLLGRYDHKKYHYLGGGSECIAQNYEH